MIFFSRLLFITTFFATLNPVLSSMDKGESYPEKRTTSPANSSQLDPYGHSSKITRKSEIEDTFKIVNGSLHISIEQVYLHFQATTLNIFQQVNVLSEKLCEVAYGDHDLILQEISINYGNIRNINLNFFSLMMKESRIFFTIKKVCIDEQLNLIITLIAQQNDHITPIISVSTEINQLPNIASIFEELFAEKTATFDHNFFSVLSFEFEFKKDYLPRSLQAICKNFIRSQLAFLQFEENTFQKTNAARNDHVLNKHFIQVFFSSLENHPSLTGIDFGNTKLYTQIEEFASLIFPVLKTCQRLRSIDLRNNYLSYLSEKKLERGIQLLVHIQSLDSVDLRDNGLKDAQIKLIRSLLPDRISLRS